MKKRWVKSYLLFYIIGSVSLSACGTDDNRLSRDKMVEVLYDIQLAEATYQVRYEDYREKKDKDALIKGVLDKHGLTLAELDSSLVWYADNPEIYMKVNDSVISLLKKSIATIDKNQIRNFGVSNVNNGILPSYYFISEDISSLTFNIDSTQVNNYPRFSLSLNTLGVQDHMKAECQIRFDYADTVIFENRSITKDEHLDFFREDSLILKGISGYFHIDTDKLYNNKILLYNIEVKNIEEQLNDSTHSASVTLPATK